MTSGADKCECVDYDADITSIADHIGDEGARHIAGTLERNTVLTQLDLMCM